MQVFLDNFMCSLGLLFLKPSITNISLLIIQNEKLALPLHRKSQEDLHMLCLGDLESLLHI